MFRIGAFSLNLETLSGEEFSALTTEMETERKRRNGSVELDISEKCMVRCGQHIQAIKSYRARTAMGLRDSKDACDAFRATIPDYPGLFKQEKLKRG